MAGIEDVIAGGLTQALGGSPILASLIIFLAFMAFAAALRAPAIVLILSGGILAILLFGPQTISTINGNVNVGGLGANTFVWVAVAFIMAIILYFAAKATVWREY